MSRFRCETVTVTARAEGEGLNEGDTVTFTKNGEDAGTVTADAVVLDCLFL